MNTAQVSIELVLAGILALCAFVLPFFGGADFDLDLLQSEALIGILGLAYLIGVIFDKLADSLMNPMEHLLRLKQADEFLNDHPKFKGDDAYPQNKLEFRLRKADDGRLEWMNSLKSRIRTSRELAVLGLPATMGIVIQQSSPEFWMFIPVALNLLFFIVTAVMDEKIKLIRTNDLSAKVADRKEQLKHAEKQARNSSAPYYLLLVTSIITITIIAIREQDNNIILFIGGGGLILSLLALWTCLRIARTYIKFVGREMPAFLKDKENQDD